MCPNISSGALWSGDRGSTGNLIDEWLANLIGLTYGMALLEHEYQIRPIEKRVVKESPIEARVVTESEDQNYFCPLCEKFKLSFEQTGFTD